MNFRIILNISGFLLILEGLFMGLAGCVSLIYEEAAYPLFLSALITSISGLLLWYYNRNVSKSISKREGYIIVSMGWILFSLFGAIPFIISKSIPSYTDAFFETISGFTTTGASILNDIESLSHGDLFWRSITQWIGGMGIIVLSLAVLPLLGIGGMQLFVAEVPGLKPDKIHPRIKETAKRLWMIYCLFTLAETAMLWTGGMSLFDAVCHSFTTMATGGYSTKQDSIMHYNSPFIHYTISAFMIIAGANFTMSYFALKFDFKRIFRNEEFIFYLKLVFGFTIIFTISLFFLQKENTFEESFRHSLFQVSSIMTTTGYITTDYLQWTPFLVLLLFLIMFLGGSSGSTGGSIKTVRILLLLKNSYLELKRLIHPNAIITVRLNKHSVPQEIISNVLAFIVFYLIIFTFGTICMSVLGLDFESAMGAVAATLGNIGPGIGSVGPVENYAHIPDLGKWLLSFFMLVGRLELFTVIILFSPAFWKK